MKWWTVLAGLFALASSVHATGVDGAYERVSLINVRTGDSPEAANRVGLLILGQGHYSMMTMNPERRVLSRDEAKSLPADEKISYLEEWLDINAHSGRYEIDSETLVWHREFSEDPREVGSTTSLHWRTDGNLLILSFTLGNGDRYDWTWQRRASAEAASGDVLE
ncbi:MAG: lipocalin-like domain-containing protein [Woeseia sp.]